MCFVVYEIVFMTLNVTVSPLTADPTSHWIGDKTEGKCEGAQRCEMSKRDTLTKCTGVLGNIEL